MRPEPGLQRLDLDLVALQRSERVREDDVDIPGLDASVGEREPDRAGVLVPGRLGIAPVVSVIRRPVPDHLAVDLGHAALLSLLEVLQEDDRATLSGHVPFARASKGRYAAPGSSAVLISPLPIWQVSALQADRRFEPAADHREDATADVPATVLERLEAPAPSASTTPQGPFMLWRIEIWPVVAA